MDHKGVPLPSWFYDRGLYEAYPFEVTAYTKHKLHFGWTGLLEIVVKLNHIWLLICEEACVLLYNKNSIDPWLHTASLDDTLPFLVLCPALSLWHTSSYFSLVYNRMGAKKPDKNHPSWLL